MTARERTRRLGAHGPAAKGATLVPASAVAGARYNEQGMRTLDSER